MGLHILDLVGGAVESDQVAESIEVEGIYQLAHLGHSD